MKKKRSSTAKSQANDEIIKRSGTLMRAGTDERMLKRQMADAENRLRTGGGLFGKGGLELINTDKKKSSGVTTIGMPINPYLWRGSFRNCRFYASFIC